MTPPTFLWVLTTYPLGSRRYAPKFSRSRSAGTFTEIDTISIHILILRNLLFYRPETHFTQ